MPTSYTCPTSMPDSVMTQSPCSMPLSVPLEIVKALVQLEASHEVIMAASVLKVVFFSR